MLYRLVLLASLPVLAAGCGSEPYQVAPVSGRVTLKGQPFAKAAVVFQPVATEGNSNPGPGSSGITDEQGQYTLKVVGQDKNGAVVGKHKVLITRVHEQDPNDDRPKTSQVPPPRGKRETPREFTVPADGTDQANFELEPKEGQKAKPGQR
jgi:hypothetical protein